jgi:hypothetical protein
MAYLTLKDAREAFERSQRQRTVRKAASQILSEEVASAKDAQRFDIFLSHCLKDAEIIAGVKRYLEEQGQSVYVDWVVDKQLDRERVTPATADVLRKRMRQSESMIIATSDNSPESRWMPWELGYFDGFRNGRVAVLPLVASEGQVFIGQEYLGLYPKIEKLPTKTGDTTPFVTKGLGSRTYMTLGSFKSGAAGFQTF